MVGRHLRAWILQAVAVSLAIAGALAMSQAAGSTTVPTGFTESTVFSGLTAPTVARFASDGRVFVAQKGGIIKVFSSLTATTSTTVANLSSEVDDYSDRGLLGLALDPNFPTSPYLYVLYTYDAAIGGTAPVWNDACPTPPGPTTDGCVVSGRLSRLTLSGNTMTNEQVLIEDWCQQFPSHSIGTLQFGPDGALYVSGGDGASYNYVDYGQSGGTTGPITPKNPCGDPPAGKGGTETPPTAEGGSLRSQSVRRPAGEPVLLNGAVLRVDPATGAALPSNPLFSNASANARRIVAYGFRNPFRFTFRPGTTDLWVGDVGWNNVEEINRSPAPTTSVLNFGWPCYEGLNPQAGYQSAALDLCMSLYTAGTATAPYYSYTHASSVVPGESCPTANGSSISGMAFYAGGSYPAQYANGLFFADYSRGCIWFMKAGSNGLPDPSQISTFGAGASGPVDLEIGPGGDLFYVDIIAGTLRRFTYAGANTPPTAVATATPTTGTTPLSVQFDGSGSSDPDAGDTLTYSWDLNGDSTFGDSTAQKPTYVYSSTGSYTVRLRVTDNHGATTTSAPITITASSGATSTFGTTTVGASTDTAGSDLKEVSRYTASAGSVLKLTGYVSGLGSTSGSQPLRAVVYADSGGNPGALLGVSNEVTVNASQAWGWVDFTFPAPFSVSSGTIWMGYIGGAKSDLAQLRYDAVAGELHYNANPGGYAAGASNPFGAPILSNKHYSLYATYVPVAQNTPPVAAASATPTSGPVPLAVQFDGSASSDPDAGDTISYSWDLNGDGTYGDSTVQKPSSTYTTAGTYTVRLRVTDNHGATTTSAPITITASTAGGTSTFGTTTPGSLVDSATVDLKEVSKYTAVAGTVSSVSGYISGLGAASGTQRVRAVIYADSGNAPAGLLGTSNEVVVTAGQAWGWVTFTFPAPVTVPSGTVWMGYIASATTELTQLRYDNVAGELHYNLNAGGYGAGPTNPFGAQVISNKHYSMYGTVQLANGNTPPTPVIDTPRSTVTYSVGDTISFSGHATDTQDVTIPASGLTWTLILHHCPTQNACHTHPIQSFTGVASGQFQAPDHEYPSYLELQLTATDSQGATQSASVNLNPNTVVLSFASSPSGAQIVVGSDSTATPFTRTVVVGSANSISAVDPQTIGSDTYVFSSWSDAGARTHNIVAPALPATYTATYVKDTPPIAVATATSPTSGTAPLTVQFDGSGSSDPDAGDTVSYSWDLNGDGTYGDSTAQKPSNVYTTAGTYAVRLRVTDNHGAATTSAPITVSVTATSGTFGVTAPGQSTDAATADFKEVTSFTAVPGRVTKLTGYISGLGKGSGSESVRAVLYADSGGNPGALLGVSSPVTIAAGRAWGWVDFTLPTPVSVTSGPVWMGYIAGGTTDLVQLRYDTATNVMRFNTNTGGYAAGPTNPFGTGIVRAKLYSLYATYVNP